MKIAQQNIALNQPGSVKIIVEEEDDLWLVYNLIAKGDTIITDTSRKVTLNRSSGNRKDSCRVKIKLEIRVTDVDYDKDSIRVKGKNLVADEFMACGAYHTLEIERNREFYLTKKLWSSDDIETLHEGSENSGADLAVILLQQGSAQVFLVGNRITTLCAKIEASRTNHKTSPDKFYDGVFQPFVKHVDFDTVRCVVLGSRASMKEEFRVFLFQEAQRLKMKSVADNNKSRFLMVKTGNKSSLKEILHDNEVMGLIKNTKAGMEIKAYKEFSDLLLTDSDRACCGPKSVEIAQEMMAIETLLITDDLLRSEEIALRQTYLESVKSVKAAGWKAFLFSSMHVSGEQLAHLTGIAAILRFPVPDLDELRI